MLSVYLDQCLPNSAFFPITSLNELADPELADVSGGGIEVVDTLPDLTIDIEADLATREMSAKIVDFVSSLPEYHADIVQRHYWLGESQSKIARDLGVTQQAISYALAKVSRMGREYFGVTVH